MPQHSSKNYYKAELQYFEQKAWDHWVNQPYCWCCWFYCDDYDNECYQREYYNDHRYSYGGWGHYEKPKECSMNCDFCFEYLNTTDKKKFVTSYFTPEEILLTLQEHLQKTNCWCYERVRSHTTLRTINKILRPRRSSSVVYIPQTLEPMILTDCVVNILYKKRGEEVKALHDLNERNHKLVVLAKYGVTLDQYNQFIIENRTRYESLNPQENPIILPKQKFIKVKESTLQEGEFPQKSVLVEKVISDRSLPTAAFA